VSVRAPGTTDLTRAALVCAVLLLNASRPALAQQFTVQGQIVEEGRTETPVAGATVTLADRTGVLSDAAGRFRINNVPAGRYVLSVRALGYAPAELTLIVSRDTTVRVALQVSPVEVDPLQVQARQVRLRGVVRDRVSGLWLIDAEVTAGDHKDRADPLGRFNLGQFPSGVPVRLQVRSFGYLPVALTMTPERDTSVVVELESDPLMQRMITVQRERIDARSEGRRYGILPVLERAELIKNLDFSIAEIIQRRLGPVMSKRIACMIVDEKPFDWRADVLLPDRVERVEFIQYPATMRRTLMVRIYTRNFVRDLIAGHSELLEKERAITRLPTQCR
jgi:hypothetical protein